LKVEKKKFWRNKALKYSHLEKRTPKTPRKEFLRKKMKIENLRNKKISSF